MTSVICLAERQSEAVCLCGRCRLHSGHSMQGTSALTEGFIQGVLFFLPQGLGTCCPGWNMVFLTQYFVNPSRASSACSFRL